MSGLPPLAPFISAALRLISANDSRSDLRGIPGASGGESEAPYYPRRAKIRELRPLLLQVRAERVLRELLLVGVAERLLRLPDLYSREGRARDISATGRSRETNSGKRADLPAASASSRCIRVSRFAANVFCSRFWSSARASTPFFASSSSRGRAPPNGFGFPELGANDDLAAAAAAGSRFLSWSRFRPACVGI